MKVIKVDILSKLHNYQQTIHYFINEVITINDKFVRNLIDRLIKELILDYDFNVATMLMVETNIDDFVGIFKIELEEELERSYYTYDADKLEEYLKDFILLAIKNIYLDIQNKSKQLVYLHNDFNTFPKIKFFSNFYASLTYYIKVENEYITRH